MLLNKARLAISIYKIQLATKYTQNIVLMSKIVLISEW